MMDLNEMVQARLGGGRVVTKTVVIAESYDGNVKSLHVMACDMPLWDLVGMLRVVGEDATAYYIGIDTEIEEEEEDNGTL